MAKSKKTHGHISVRQTASVIGTDPRVRATLHGLGLGRIGKQKTLIDSPQVRGMIAKVHHLVAVLDDAAA
ncbi:MAG: 50S ribosomal protein L30 [Holosporales bacterium]|jgi:large subunit ribosomal protein L30